MSRVVGNEMALPRRHVFTVTGDCVAQMGPHSHRKHRFKLTLRTADALRSHESYGDGGLLFQTDEAVIDIPCRIILSFAESAQSTCIHVMQHRASSSWWDRLMRHRPAPGWALTLSECRIDWAEDRFTGNLTLLCRETGEVIQGRLAGACSTSHRPPLTPVMPAS